MNDTSRPSNRYLYLPLAAKAALEVGEYGKAQSYAIEGLRLADQEAAKHKNRANPRSYPGVGTADFYCNFVLGRLAILNGEIRIAEQYLLAASKTLGNASLDSYGPNMSLANELLKRGDAQSWPAVYTFLQNCRSFWSIDHRVIDEWAADVKNHKLPDFKEQLYRF